MLGFTLLTAVLGSNANQRADEMLHISGGKFACRIDLPEWKRFYESYWACRSYASSCDILNLREDLYALVLTNHSRVLECNVGVIAGYALIGQTAVHAQDVSLAYRSYQMAMVFIYTLRTKQRIPIQQELLWRVSTDDIISKIQALRMHFNYATESPIVHVSTNNERIGLVSICAYPDNHPLILKDITPVNRETYTSRHKYKAIVVKTHPFGLGSNVCIQHSKLALMHSLLESGLYDWLMWLDCDSIIVNQERKVSHIIERYSTADTHILMTEELLGLSSANWIIRNSEWSREFLKRAFHVANHELPYFGDQDAIISLAMGRGVLDSHFRIIPQGEINTYDALNAFYMGSRSYDVGDFLITFPQCKDVACNELFQTAFNASSDSAKSILNTPIEERSWTQLRVFGPGEVVAKLYQQYTK